MLHKKLTKIVESWRNDWIDPRKECKDVTNKMYLLKILEKIADLSTRDTVCYVYKTKDNKKLYVLRYFVYNTGQTGLTVFDRYDVFSY